MKSEDEAHHGWNEEIDSDGVKAFELTDNGKLHALGRFDMEEEEHDKQCKATRRVIEIEAPSPCANHT